VCAGAHRAQQMRDWEGRSGQPVYVVKDPAEERDDTDPAGVITVESLEQIPRGGTVFFPAHGVSRAHADATRARGTDLIDATCPLVASMHHDVRAFAARGDAVVVIGDRDGAAVAALAGQAPESVTVVESVADVAALHLNQDRVSFVIGGGLPVETATPVLAALRAKYPRLRGQHPDSFCYAASDRAETLRTVAAASDVTLVLGTLSQRRATQMARLVTAHGSDIHLIAGISEIRPEWLAGAATVGITATPSADSRAQDETIDALSGLGPLSVVRRRVVTDVVKPNHRG
jgi:4-hydroxy-3-methylbut-2-en-1-yl diphosphate reductase